jgi:hypothetical protein
MLVGMEGQALGAEAAFFFLFFADNVDPVRWCGMVNGNGDVNEYGFNTKLLVG